MIYYEISFSLYGIQAKADLFIKEFYDNKSEINGSGALERFLEQSTYEEWLQKVLADIDIANIEKSRVPALKVCDAIGIKEVIVTCDKSNIASAKVIKNCGGLIETEFYSSIFKNEIQKYIIKR